MWALTSLRCVDPQAVRCGSVHLRRTERIVGGSCELVPPVVFQAGQWPATRKPGDRDRDALILLPLDARQTQTAGGGGATAEAWRSMPLSS
jgi:hypothetical protein